MPNSTHPFLFHPLVLLLVLHLIQTVRTEAASLPPATCEKDEDCGWQSSCISMLCACPANFTLHANGQDCKLNICEESDCVECTGSGQCTRCVYFISRASQHCIKRCSGQAEIVHTGPLQGNVCTETSGTEIIVAVVAGVAAGILLCITITLSIVFYLRRTRKNVNLQQTSYNCKEMEMGNVKQIPGYDNKAFEPEGEDGGFHMGVVDPLVYQRELEALRPHTETLMTVLAQIRRKLRAMEPADPRVPTYKGVIHQLCRVLVLLHRKETSCSIPSDALGLIQWAQQMLEDHREQDELDYSSSIGASEVPVSRISYVDGDLEGNENPHVYAIPGTAHDGRLAESGQTSGYYSSVPVPGIEPGAEGYATVRRTPSIPNTGDLQAVAVKSVSGRKREQGKKRRTVIQEIGYFANGRYYDPNPNPTSTMEVYAPASSYSDRSAGPLMTFQADSVPPSESFSETSSSISKTGKEAEEEEEENDVFPFDPQEATDPVEV